MIWSGISWDGPSSVSVSMTGQRNRDEILDAHVRLQSGAVGSSFISMAPHSDNTWAAWESLERERIERLELPAHSASQNLIEHLWQNLPLAVSARQVHPRTAQEVGVILVQDFNNVPQRTIQNLTASKKRHCQAVIYNHGSHIRYQTKNKPFYHLLSRLRKLPPFSKQPRLP